MRFSGAYSARRSGWAIEWLDLPPIDMPCGGFPEIAVGDEVLFRGNLGLCECCLGPLPPGDGNGGSCPVLRTDME